MRFLLRIILYITLLFITLSPVLINCNESNNNNLLMFLLSISSDSNIYIFNGGQYNGDLMTAGSGANGRIGADNLCKTAQAVNYSFLNGKTVKAFLSVSSTDLIKDVMPVDQWNRPVYGIKTDASKTLVKNSWNDLWSGEGINTTLGAATGIATYWWNASEVDGTYYSDDTASCTNWTYGGSPSPPAGVGGDYESSSGTDDWWIRYFGSSCSGTYNVLCVAY